MKISISWLKELVDLKISDEELIKLLPLRTIGTKEITPDFVELDMKGYNRADLLSMRGIAYEVAAITDSQTNFKELDEEDFTWSDQNFPQVKVEVRNKTLAPFYAVAKIEGLKVGPSNPEWIKKLSDSGMRSVNNIADITNLIMLEYGQPLHAFDAAAVKDETIIVRTAEDKEKITTLDSKERDLTNSDLLIADPQKAVGIAGVMGGKNSEVTEGTSSILLEAAIFDPINLRQTATRLNLPSEAGKRFQHGLTKKSLLQALDRAIKMYEILGGKLVAITIMGEWEDSSPTVNLTLNKLQSLIGVEITPELVEESLSKLYFKVIKVGEGKWEVIPPYFRLDIKEEEDLIEEVARLYGYEKIPSKPLEKALPAPIDQKLFHFLYDLKKELVKIGLTETQTYSFYPTTVIDNLRLDTKELIKIGNPMSKETEYMRDMLWPNLVKVATDNLKYKDDLAIFEVGKVYLQSKELAHLQSKEALLHLQSKELAHPAKKADLPEEKYVLSIALTSSTTTAIQELYWVFLKLAKNFNLKFNVEQIEPREKEGEWFHPKRVVGIKHQGKEKGFMAEIHPRITDLFGTGKRIAVLETDIKLLIKDLP